MKVMLLSIAASAIVAAGCSTPVVKLRNNAGQVVQCGGGKGGSLAGGMIGHNMEKERDEKCAKDYEARGYKRIP